MGDDSALGPDAMTTRTTAATAQRPARRRLWPRLLGATLATVAVLTAAAYHFTPGRDDQLTTPRATQGDLPFPAGFLWGAALAGHQAETRQASDWGAFEEAVVAQQRFSAGPAYGSTQPGHIRDFGRWPAAVQVQKSAFDSHYEQDIQAAADMGLNALRISIEWARLFPRAGMAAPDPEGIAYYERVFAAMRARGIEPIVTLFHYVSPAWFFAPDAQGRKGWERADALAHWQQFVDAVATHFVPTVKTWCTLNEPMVYLYSGYVDGSYPPLERRGDLGAAADVYAALLQAHARAYATLHRVAAERHASVQVGLTQNLQAYAPLRPMNLADRAIAGIAERAWNWDFLDAVHTGRLGITTTGVDREIPGLRGTQDYVGVNYYTRIYLQGSLAHLTEPEVVFHDPARPDETVTDMGWTVYPRGLHDYLVQVHRRYGKPVMVLENGRADARADDTGRAAYLTAHLRELWLAMHDEGVDVRAYVQWSLLDNFEWAEGFGPRFGLIAVDYEHDFQRTPRQSTALVRRIATGNALPADLIGEAAPR